MSGKNFTPFPTLRTERLLLRRLEETDRNEIFSLRSSEQVNKYLNRKPAESIDEATGFIRMVNRNIQSNESVYWTITRIGTDKLIGTICLFGFSADNLQAEIGYELLPEYEGRGAMQEAIQEVINFGKRYVGLNSILASSHVNNAKSIKLLERLGFKRQLSVEGDLITFIFSVD